MNCRICNSAPDSRGYCPNCGFDEGLAHEYYPTLQQLDGLSLSGRRKNWEEKNSTQKSETIPSSKDHVSSAQSKKGVSSSRIWTIIIVAAYMISMATIFVPLFVDVTWITTAADAVEFVLLTILSLGIIVAPAIVVLLSLKKRTSKTIIRLSEVGLAFMLAFMGYIFFMHFISLIPPSLLTLLSTGFLDEVLIFVIFLAFLIGSFIIAQKLTVANASDEESQQKKD